MKEVIIEDDYLGNKGDDYYVMYVQVVLVDVNDKQFYYIMIEKLIYLVVFFKCVKLELLNNLNYLNY